MKILGIESSARAASAAVIQNGVILSSFYINNGLTHSRTLAPMIESVTGTAGIGLNDIDLVAVNTGPGSFTGVRIGVACAKGLSDVLGIPCAGISTLESLAYNYCDTDCTVFAAMDARCSQIYGAVFDITCGTVKRLAPDTALPFSDVEKKLDIYKKIKIFVGDGAEICYNSFGWSHKDVVLADEARRYQSAVSVCRAAERLNSEAYVSGAQLRPTYLRPPQAERELVKKQKGM
ncbi:MAG: tRNA (adenosine(37)-N6)-threonylcarbamoyltransferase complex dimerization subunit type 1 TsaB [Clostridia bacterium]|nr:tRNA (adenosine(37)-N6)-threonylcarbamoyltransferase complex dimerization subunit type 1 TsaB [Clostridia bacterium]